MWNKLKQWFNESMCRSFGHDYIEKGKELNEEQILYQCKTCGKIIFALAKPSIWN